jgi:tRNA threonylcarbamoyladenosine biosynthesis protein TsaE
VNPTVRQVASPEDMEQLGRRIADHVGAVRRIYLTGALGAGKTTLMRGLLRGLGHEGAVKSPTFTLVEPYSIDARSIYHFDLYRLKSPEELEFLGIRDYFATDSLCIVEWAERAQGLLPQPDVEVKIVQVDTKRRVQLISHSDAGTALLDGLG